MERTTKGIAALLLREGFLLSLTALFPYVGRSLGSDDRADRERATFIVIEYPGAVRMYNQYEQRLSPAEHKQMVPFLPMRIVDRSAFLSDGFTPCMKVEIEGKLFYIQIDERGRVISVGGAGFLQEYRNVRQLDDIVRVHVPGRLTFTSGKGKRSLLEKYALLKRYFSYGASVFARRVDRDSSFGWVKLDSATENSLWSVLMPPAERGIPASVAEKVGVRLHEVNRHLRMLFEQFSKESGRRRAVPEWRAGMERDALVCVLASDSSAHAFAGSTRLLANDIEGFLIGTNLTLRISPRRIEIRSR